MTFNCDCPFCRNPDIEKQCKCARSRSDWVARNGRSDFRHRRSSSRKLRRNPRRNPLRRRNIIHSSPEHCQWVTYNRHAAYGEPLWVPCGRTALMRGMCSLLGISDRGTSNRRNPDKETQQLLNDYISGGDKESLVKYIRILMRRGDGINPGIIKMYISDLDQDGRINDDHDEIFDGMSKGFFVFAWADEIDRIDMSPGGDYYYNSPPTPTSAIDYAKKYESDLIKSVGLSLNGFYTFVKKIMNPRYDRDMTPEHFGYLIAASAAGSGVGLEDAVPSELQSYVDVPYGEDYELIICENCGHIEPDNDHECE